MKQETHKRAHLTRFGSAVFCLCLAVGLVGFEQGRAQSIQLSVTDTTHTEFHATFTVASLPTPLQECRVTLTLEFKPLSADKVITEDVAFSVWGTDERLQLVGDTLFTWPSPIRPRQFITHEFAVVPRMSGTSWVIVSPGRRSNGGYPIGPRFAFNLDESGSLCYLSSPASGQVAGCDKVVGYFLSPVMSSLTMAAPDQQIWRARFTPLPRAGDTCHVQFDIVTPISWPAGASIDIHAEGFAVLTLPQPIDRSLSAGTPLRLELLAVADSVPGGKELRLQLVPDLADRESSVLSMIQARLCFWYDYDSSLRYAAMYPIAPVSEQQGNRSETTCRPTLEQYRISPSGNVPIRFGSARKAWEDSSIVRH